ncbi:MAG: hypothetical protein RSE41_00185 [Clostridia bacterium]
MKKLLLILSIVLYLCINVYLCNLLIDYKGMEENTPYIIPFLLTVLCNSIIIACIGFIYAFYNEIKK